MVRRGGAAILLAATSLLLGVGVRCKAAEGAEEVETLVGLPCTSICTLVDTSPQCNRCRDREPLRFGKRSRLPQLAASSDRWSLKKGPARLESKAVRKSKGPHKQETSPPLAAVIAKASSEVLKRTSPIPSKNVKLPSKSWSGVASSGSSVRKPVSSDRRRIHKRFLFSSPNKKDQKLTFGRRLLGMFKKGTDFPHREAKSVSWQPPREPMRFGKRARFSRGTPFDLLMVSLSETKSATPASPLPVAPAPSNGVTSNRLLDGQETSHRLQLRSSQLQNQPKRSIGRHRLKQNGVNKGSVYWDPRKVILSAMPFHKTLYVRPEFKRDQLREYLHPEPMCAQSGADGAELDSQRLGKVLSFLRRTPMG